MMLKIYLIKRIKKGSGDGGGKEKGSEYEKGEEG